MPKLKIAQHVKLHTLVNEEYTKSGQNDQEFATMASAKLGFIISPNQVQEARRTYAIPSLRQVAYDAKKVSIADRIAALEAAVAAMQAKWANLEGVNQPHLVARRD